MYGYTTGPTGGPLPELPFIVLDEDTEKSSWSGSGIELTVCCH